MIVIVLVLVMAREARADEHPPSYPSLSGAVGVILRDDKGGGSETTSAGVNVELAHGRGRFQYFLEGSTSSVQGYQRGLETRGGLGVRWLARAFDLFEAATIELHLEGVTGLTRVGDHSGDPRVYPDLGFGVGWQIRRSRPARFAFRVTARAVFAQTERAMTCRTEGATCTPASSVPGFVALFGFAW